MRKTITLCVVLCWAFMAASCGTLSERERPRDFSWVYDSIRRDTVKRLSWLAEPVETGGGSQLRPVDEVIRELQESLFMKGKDDAMVLLQKARNGDRPALRKLISYIEQNNPKWRHRVEVFRINAESQGVWFVARYYEALAESRGVPYEKAQFEAAVRLVETRAEGGDWIAALGLFKLMKELESREISLPWGDSAGLSARYLAWAHRDGKGKVTDALITK